MQLESEHGEAGHHDDRSKNDDEDEDDDEDTSSSEEEGESAPVRRQRGGRSQLLTFKDVEASLETFDGDSKINVRRWVKDFEEMAVLCDWSDIQKVAYAKRLLRGSAKLFVKYERHMKTWGKLRQALIEEFTDIVDSHAVHQELQRRKRTHDGTYQAYVYKMLEIASQAEVDTRSVIQYIIEGIQDDPVNKTVLHGAKTIRELKERFVQYEAIRKEGNPRTKRVKLEEKKGTF